MKWDATVKPSPDGLRPLPRPSRAATRLRLAPPGLGRFRLDPGRKAQTRAASSRASKREPGASLAFAGALFWGGGRRGAPIRANRDGAPFDCRKTEIPV